VLIEQVLSHDDHVQIDRGHASEVVRIGHDEIETMHLDVDRSKAYQPFHTEIAEQGQDSEHSQSLYNDCAVTAYVVCLP
jgi:hypothetical protein